MTKSNDCTHTPSQRMQHDGHPDGKRKKGRPKRDQEILCCKEDKEGIRIFGIGST